MRGVNFVGTELTFTDWDCNPASSAVRTVGDCGGEPGIRWSDVWFPMKTGRERNSYCGVGRVSFFLASVRQCKQLAFEGFVFITLSWIYYEVGAAWEHRNKKILYWENEGSCALWYVRGIYNSWKPT